MDGAPSFQRIAVSDVPVIFRPSLETYRLENMKLAYLVPMQKRFQVVETEGTTNRNGLCCITRPKLTVWVVANGSEDCVEVKYYQCRPDSRNAYALRQSAGCLELRQRICFVRREP